MLGRGSVGSALRLFQSHQRGDFHTCGLRADGKAVCWGGGRWSPPSDSFVAISAGGRHTCGLRADGKAVCWGDDESGQSSPPDATFMVFAPTPAHGGRVAFSSDRDGNAEIYVMNADGSNATRPTNNANQAGRL